MNTSNGLPAVNPTNNTENSASTTSRVFADPVAYLASLGIEAQLIDVSTFPAAA